MSITFHPNSTTDSAHILARIHDQIGHGIRRLINLGRGASDLRLPSNDWYYGQFQIGKSEFFDYPRIRSIHYLRREYRFGIDGRDVMLSLIITVNRQPLRLRKEAISKNADL